MDTQISLPATADQLAYTILHLTCRFIRKRKGQNVPWRRFARANQVSNPMREHTRLPASRSSHNQKRAIYGFYCFALLGVQLFDRI